VTIDTTQAATEISGTRSFASQAGQVLTEVSGGRAFSVQAGQAALEMAASGAFRAAVTQADLEVSVRRPIVTQPRREVHLFSTGTLLTLAEGVLLKLALLQNVSMRFRSGRTLLHGSLQRSPFPVDAAFEKSEAVLTAETASLNPGAIAQLLGGDLSGTTALQVVSLARRLGKMPFTAILTLLDTHGVTEIWTFNTVYCPDLTLPVTAADFLKPGFTMVAVPDRAGTLISVQMGQ
jgi:hypothetical protein